MNGLVTPELIAFDAVTEELTGGRTRVRAEYVPLLRTLITCFMQRHVRAIQTLESNPAKKTNANVVKQLEFRRKAVGTLRLLVEEIAHPVPRREFWAIAEDYLRSAGVIGPADSDPAA